MSNIHHLQPPSASVASGAASSSSSASVSPSLPAATMFSTSSTDFALPFGGKVATNNHTDALLPSRPISIPSSPSLSATNLNRQGVSSSISISPSKFSPRHASFYPASGSASGAGLGLASLSSPSLKEHPNPLLLHPSFPQPQSPTLHALGESWLPASPGSSTLLRRGPGMTSPGFAVASPARFRRASMLGREVTPFQLDQEGSDNDQSITQYKAVGQTEADDDGDDEMMQLDEDSASATQAPSTPAMGPPAPLLSTPGTPPNGTSLSNSLRRQGTLALTRMTHSDSGHDSSSSAGERNAHASSSRLAKSPSLVQQSGSPLPHGGRSRSSSLLSGNAIRKPGARRGSILPRDRSVLRVAASLQDEDRPEDSEIASEAKLQKRLGGDAIVPRTPRIGGDRQSSSSRMNKSPFLGSSHSGSAKHKYMWDDQLDDIQSVFVADGLDDADSSGLSSEGEEMAMYYSRTSSYSDEEDQHRNDRSTADDKMIEDALTVSRPTETGIYTDLDGISEVDPSDNGGTRFASASLGASSSSSSLPKRKSSLWMGFRDKGHVHKWSPGSGSGGAAFNDRGMLRRSGGSGTTMDVETSPRIYAAHSAGVNARLSKRKMAVEERYGPYKRRAVSPMNLGAAVNTNTGVNGGPATPIASTGTGHQGGGGGTNSPSFLPISSPSSSLSAAGGILYRGGAPSSSAAAVAAAAAAHHHHHHYHHHYARYSTSPTISRPCTPTHSHPTPTFSATGGSSFSPAAAAGSGSGPGYGSGALGLAISANHTASPTLKALEQEENEAMDQRVGMLGLS